LRSPTTALVGGNSANQVTRLRLYSTDDCGETWTVGGLPTDFGAFTCPDFRTCWLIGLKGSSSEPLPVARTTDGGVTWKMVAPPSRSATATGLINAVLSCPESRECVVAMAVKSGGSWRSELATTTDGGSS
jgi:photosystem II stability/assembly factor-like uncharacterized protein